MKPFSLIIILIAVMLFAGPVCAEAYNLYALACPFKTVADEITYDEFVSTINQSGEANNGINAVYFSPSAAQDLGSIHQDWNLSIDENAAEKITDASGSLTCAVIPFEELTPEMKYIRVGQEHYPWDKEYDPAGDVLAIPAQPGTYDRTKLTTLLMTGTTALVRTTSYKMFVNGPLYPAELMKPVFDDADITHVSNESSIWSLCPDPLNTFGIMQFCTQENAYDLFDYLGVDVIELSGNHLRDYDWMPLLEMLNKFDEKEYHYYAAGRNFEEAARPLFMEHNGNNFVFLGCNIAGPDHVYVDERHPGVNHCDFDKMEQQIKDYAEQNYLVIVTVQYYETYSRVPTEKQERDFKRLSEAGAVVVSGSQAHYSQTMLPAKDRFIHYGLGNLFFDQMDTPVKGTSLEFLDKYVFYEGRLLNVQLITTVLTDFARPRLMDESERTEFLDEIFSLMN